MTVADDTAPPLSVHQIQRSADRIRAYFEPEPVRYAA
jgi:hypothetical protein